MKQEAAPASAETIEVAPGVLRIQLPINFTGLGHTNMYVMEDSRGAVVVDTGLPGRNSWRALQAGLRQAGIPTERVHSILITHSHPDHFGNAARLAEASGGDIFTHRSFQVWWTPDSHDSIPDQSEDETARNARRGFMPWHGADYRPALTARLRGWWMRTMGHRMFPTPEPGRRVDDAHVLRVGDRRLEAIHTPGHTADHLCWWDGESGVLFSGDHVLPTITPHIAGIGAGPDPLADYQASLERIGKLAGTVVALPAHGDPIDDVGGRIDSIKRHHVERLDQLRNLVAASGPMSVEALARDLFPRRLWGFMAESETFAHIEHLRFKGEVTRCEVGGRVLFERTG